MDTRQLAAFCAVVERRSFSQAAEKLGVTQPAVSLQIRSLEKRLRQQLLDRSGRRVEPTTLTHVAVVWRANDLTPLVGHMLAIVSRGALDPRRGRARPARHPRDRTTGKPA